MGGLFCYVLVMHSRHVLLTPVDFQLKEKDTNLLWQDAPQTPQMHNDRQIRVVRPNLVSLPHYVSHLLVAHNRFSIFEVTLSAVVSSSSVHHYLHPATPHHYYAVPK